MAQLFLVVPLSLLTVDSTTVGLDLEILSRVSVLECSTSMSVSIYKWKRDAYLHTNMVHIRWGEKEIQIDNARKKLRKARRDGDDDKISWNRTIHCYFFSEYFRFTFSALNPLSPSLFHFLFLPRLCDISTVYYLSLSWGLDLCGTKLFFEFSYQQNWSLWNVYLSIYIYL